MDEQEGRYIAEDEILKALENLRQDITLDAALFALHKLEIMIESTLKYGHKADDSYIEELRKAA